MDEFKEKVERGRSVTLSVVDGDLLLEGSTVLPADRIVVVHGTVLVRHRSVVKGSLKADSVRGEGDLEVQGDLEGGDVRLDDGASLEVGGNLRADSVDVPNTLKVTGSTNVDDLDVGGTAFLTGPAKTDDVRVGGTLKALAMLEADGVRVGGILEAKTLVCDDVNVGGSLRADVLEADDVKVGGTVEVTGESKVDGLTVGGTARFAGGVVKDARVGGTLKSAGALTFERIDAGGQLTMESGSGERITVGGLLEVSKDLILEDGLSVGGRAKIGGTAKAGRISVGGELEASSATAEDKLSVGGDLSTEHGSKASEVEIGRRARVRGPLVGETVKVREDVEAEDIHAESLWLGDHCNVRNVFVQRAEIGRECVISGRLLYTEAVSLGKDVRLTNQPEKVTVLPSPPL